MIGPEHVGKASAARWLAQLSLCATGQACGQCLACRQIISGEHPLVVDIKPAGDSIGIDDVREALHRWVTAPSHDDQRWLIISDIDRIHESGGNALLKFVEDLPKQTRVIMTSSHPDRSLATLRSRAAVYRWHLVHTKALETWLGERKSALSGSSRTAIAARAAGRPGLAALMAESGQNDQAEFDTFLETFTNPIVHLQQLAPEDPSATLATVTLGLREVLMVSLHAQRRLWPQSVEQAQTLHDRRSTADWLQTLERSLTAAELLSHNAQPRIVLNDLLLA